MKFGLFVVVVLLLGSGIGAGTAWLRAANPGPAYGRFVTQQDEPFFPPDPNAAKGTPKVETPEGTEFDFGVMGVDQTGSHRFPIKNVGNAPLSLVIRDTTCSCTLGDLEDSEVPPGGSTFVTLEWTPKGYAESFRQMATLGTNDPDQDEIFLGVQGRVIPILRTEPKDVNFGDIPAAVERSTDFMIYAYDRDDLEVLAHQWLNADTAHAFQLEMTPDPEAAKLEPHAKMALRCRIQVKPGLSLGAFYQRLIITTNEPRIGDIEVTVAGSIVSEITLTGKAFDKSRNLLRLDSISQTSGAEQLMSIYVKGAEHEQVTLKVEQTDPADVLQVTLGEPQHLQPVSYHKLTLRIPPNSPLVNRLGSQEHPWGKIEISTTHPDVPKITIYVQFAVTN